MSEEQKEQKEKSLTKVKKALYLAARSCVPARFKENPEQVKYLRDSTCMSLLGKHYQLCTGAELEYVCEYLNLLGNHEREEKKATISQLRLLRYYQFHFALQYCNWDSAIFRADGKNLTGLNLKNFVYEKVEKKQKIDASIYRFMFETCINPRSHLFLLEGGFKQMVRNNTKLHYEYLKTGECNYLIQRFAHVYLQLSDSGKLNTVEYLGALN